MQAIKGYVENGRFYPLGQIEQNGGRLFAVLTVMDETVKIPEKTPEELMDICGFHGCFCGKKHFKDPKDMTEEELEELRQARLEVSGSMKIWMSDDFKAPLEEMEEYM
ncbi:MAG: hypothetical protein FWB74_02110 [Defluviitaleaceae bacterium]|nr:hypothetical protein [Defluviitaleaceae bacterium]